MKLPILFVEKVKQPATQGGRGYPFQIKADDLDKNFVYAALDAEDGYIEEAPNQGGHTGRKLTFPPIPPGGRYVLGVDGGVLTWMETTDC
jgi:hypothetical protein